MTFEGSNSRKPVTAEDLVVGPRGRRFLLEFAVASEHITLGEEVDLPFGLAVFDVSFRLTKDHGQAIARFGWGDWQTRPELTIDDVASRLSEVSLVPPASKLLEAALAASVDSAMYWQQPDGRDLLCATPKVRAALVRVAEHMAGSPALQAWAAPFEPGDQWQVVWDDQRSPQPNLHRWQQEMLEQEQVARRERPANPDANWSGEWWSHPPHGLTTSTGSFGDAGPHGLWLVEDAFNWEAASVHRVEVDESARIYQIDGAGAWTQLCAVFPLEVTASKRHDWYRTTGRSGRWVIPDWSLVAEHYDGVHLSIAGYLRAATSAIEVGDADSVIAGWNPDTTWWLNPTARTVGDPIRWHATHDHSDMPRGNWIRTGR